MLIPNLYRNDYSLSEIAYAFGGEIKRVRSIWMAGCIVSTAFLIPLRAFDCWYAYEEDLNRGTFSYRIAAKDVAIGPKQTHIALGRWLKEHASPDATIVLFDARACYVLSSITVMNRASACSAHRFSMSIAKARTCNPAKVSGARSSSRASGESAPSLRPAQRFARRSPAQRPSGAAAAP